MSPKRLRITGSGPVALACALFMQRRGIAAGQIELDLNIGPVPEALSARVLAISEGSCQVLSRVIALPRAGLIEQVEVSMQGHAGRTRIDASDLDVTRLGRVMRYGSLLDALRTATARHAWATEDASQPAALTIHAEGDAGEDARVRDFDQSALLGEVHALSSSTIWHSTAFERFTPHGPLALLPLPEPGRFALVWCDRDATCHTRLQADREALSKELTDLIGARLGAVSMVGPLSVAKLTRRLRRDVVRGEAVWIGNAAQSLHPVAGQGLNLGLRDAFELADELACALRRDEPIERSLARWQSSRRPDRLGTVAITDLMASSFTWPLARPLQSPMLMALDLMHSLRRPLAARLMFGGR